MRRIAEVNKGRMYRAETWAALKVHKLDVAETRMLRWMSGIHANSCTDFTGVGVGFLYLRNH